VLRDMMAAAALSLLGFGAFLALDLGALRGKPGAHTATTVVGAASLLSAAALSWPMGESLRVSLPARLSGVALAAAGAALLAYSLFIELAAAQRREDTRPRARAGAGVARLVRTGTYALCRHPGYWWLLIFLAGLVLAADRSGMLLLAAGWAGLNLILVIAQDWVVFPRRFPDYPSYRRATPFLIPSACSIRAAIHTFRGNA
jgi:protein-S-isoprenylcysteine O-methyltransferase Ste14